MKTNANTTSSNDGYTSPPPLQARFSTPPSNNFKAYCYMRDGLPRKNLKIQTPNGTIKEPQKYEIGQSHQVVMSKIGKRYIPDNFFKVATADERKLCLMAALINLKHRAKVDYDLNKRNAYDLNGHHRYSRNAITTCITYMKVCINEASNKQALIDYLNEKIDNDIIYNPFGLGPIYQDSQYLFGKAKIDNKYRAHLELKEINPTVPSRQSNAYQSGSSVMSQSSTLFKPRQVIHSTLRQKRKLEHHSTQDPGSGYNKSN